MNDSIVMVFIECKLINSLLSAEILQ